MAGIFRAIGLRSTPRPNCLFTVFDVRSSRCDARPQLVGAHLPLSRPLSSTSSQPNNKMPVFYHPCYHVDLPSGHRFPMERYRATHELLRSAITDAPRVPLDIRTSRVATRDEIIAAHDAEYWDGYAAGTLPANAYREIGFPWSPDFVERTATITGGTLQAVEVALRVFRHRGAGGGSFVGPGGIAANQAGGTHHAFRDKGEGFCIVNDLSVAARWAQAPAQRALWGDPPAASIGSLKSPATNANTGHPPSSGSSHASSARHRWPRVLVIDLDVHQGNGTAAIHADDASVYTFSMHGAKNWPWRSRVGSDFDVDVPDGGGDDVFLPLLKDALRELDTRLRDSARPFRGSGVDLGQPESMIGGVRASGPDPSLGVGLVLYQAGADPLSHDRLGRLQMTRSGLRERNELVYRWAEARGLPVAVTMGGGYARPIELSARCHVDVFVQAAQSWDRRARAYEAFCGKGPLL